MKDFPHISVLGEGHHPCVFDVLLPEKGNKVLDATLGLGGHAESFLRTIGPSGHLYAIDADQDNLDTAKARLSIYGGNVTYFHTNFRNTFHLELPPLDIIFADLGLSSPHLDDASRGFTFHEDAPLDMRFDKLKGQSAAEMLSSSSEEDIAFMLVRYGEVRGYRRLASALYQELRRGGGLATTGALRRIVERVYGYKANIVLPQVFQAFRIAVNDELGALQQFITDAPALLKEGGRMGVISFHSLEDRMVKREFKRLSAPKMDERTGAISEKASFSILTKKPVAPSLSEIAQNPRARSAKFRAIVREHSA